MSTNGTVDFLTNATDAGTQAVADIKAFVSQKEQMGAAAPEVIAAIGALSGIIAAAAAATSAASSVAQLATADKGTLEIEIENNSTQPVVLYNYVPSGMDITKLAVPLGPGESDIITLTSTSKFNPGNSISLDLFVGAITVTVNYKYTDSGSPGRWQLTLVIDKQKPTQGFPLELQLMGATFKGSGSNPSFSVYTAPIETSSGEMSLTFYDLASS